MKVLCDRSALLEVVNSVAGVVASRTPAPVLQCVKLAVADGVLALSATDLEVGLHLVMGQVEVQSDGEVLVPADKLAQIVRSSDDTTLTLESDEHALHIRGADSHFTIYGYDPKEAPRVRTFEGEVDCTLDAEVMQTLIERTLFAAAAEHSRYAINGILFNRDGKQLRMVATDGRRLALAKGQCESAAEGSSSCIIPSKALALISKLMRDPDAEVKIVIEENQALFSVDRADGTAVLSSNLVEGTFPPFEDVIPKDQDKKVTFDVNVLRSAIKRAALLTNEESKGVRLSFATDKLTLTSRAPEMGEAEIQVEVKRYEGEPVEIGFNPGFITDALKVIDTESVDIELKASNKPGVLRTGTDFTYVVMPVSLA